MAKGLMGLICCFVLTVVIFTESVSATNYTVGDALGWTNIGLSSPKYYSDTWDENKNFKIGDILIFNWTGIHDVAKVNTEDEYDQCTTTSATILSNTSPFMYTINTTGDHYFICTIGAGAHCSSGQKLNIDVDHSNTPATPSTPTTPTTTPSTTTKTPSSSPSFAPFGTLSAAVCTLVFYIFL